MVMDQSKHRIVIVACLCVALLVTQLFVTINSTSASFLSDIQVNRTVSQFVSPLVSPLGTGRLDAMHRSAGILVADSKLPKRDWLLDDSKPQEFSVYLSDSVAAVSDEFQSDNTAWFLVIVAITTIGIYKGAVAFAEFINEQTLNEEAENAEAVVAENGGGAATYQAFVYAVEQAVDTDDTDAVVQAVQTVGGWPAAMDNKKKAMMAFAQTRREMMLLFELDTKVLGAL